MSAVDGLDVYLHGLIAGVLERRSQAKLRFTYNEDWVAEDRSPLSLSLPVRAESYDHDECAPFFEGLLPEGDFLKAIARTLHVSATNPFQLLTELGGECAGAISVAPADGPLPGQDPRAPRWLGEKELSGLLADLPRRPLIAAIDEVEDGGGFRLSLAGAQNKVGVLADGNEIGLSYGRPPTTEILKAPIPHVVESVANEAFCMILAAQADLDVAHAEPRNAIAEEYLLVHRYDRSDRVPDGRIHQEDFCQALGLVPAVKYEREGGPSVADCAQLIRRHCSAPVRDITAFLDALLFNFLIANHDAHSKNYSLLLDGPGSIRLAPLYDLLCTVVFSRTDRKLAMRYGGENRPAYLRSRHLDRLAGELGVKPSLVRRRAIALCERMESAVEAARRSLPDAFQDRSILDQMEAVIAERVAMLAERASEPREQSGRAPRSAFVDVEDDLLESGGGLAAIGAAVRGIGEDLDGLSSLFNRVEGDDAGLVASLAREDDLLGELAERATSLKLHGREMFDSVVAFDSAVESLFDRLELTDGAPDLLVTFQHLSTVAAEGLEASEKLHATVTELPDMDPALRAPVRNLRAGLRDSRDAWNVMVGWGRRAKDLRTEG